MNLMNPRRGRMRLTLTNNEVKVVKIGSKVDEEIGENKIKDVSVQKIEIEEFRMNGGLWHRYMMYIRSKMETKLKPIKILD